MTSPAQKSRIYFNFEDEYFVENQGITQSNEKVMRTGDQRGHVKKNIVHEWRARSRKEKQITMR